MPSISSWVDGSIVLRTVIVFKETGFSVLTSFIECQFGEFLDG